MNRLKFIFLLVLSVVSIGGLTTVSAQTNDKILVSNGGKTLRQSDVDQLINFYEWAFQAQFNSTQRSDFQSFTVAEFRANPAESRKTIDDIVNTFPRILAASDDVQAETRKNFLAAFLPEARKNNDANSQMLLSIYEYANGSISPDETDASRNETSDTKEDSQFSNVGNISALEGVWNWGRSGSMTTTTSGVYLGGNASRHTYKFSANGAVEYTGIMNVMTGGCRMQIFKSSKGTAMLSGDTLTIKWSPAAFSRADSCSPSKDYKKTLPAETETFRVKLKTDAGQRQLCLTGSDETCYSASN